ncbi:MAG: hypothetical protein WD005_04470 [Haliea sp.]
MAGITWLGGELGLNAGGAEKKQLLHIPWRQSRRAAVAVTRLKDLQRCLLQKYGIAV